MEGLNKAFTLTLEGSVAMLFGPDIFFFAFILPYITGESTNHSCTLLYLHWHQEDQLPFMQIAHNFVDHKNL